MNNQTKSFDAIIIGVGQAGNPLAKKLIDQGWSIAVVEKEFEGGSCINYGCTPTKAMISSAKTAYVAKHSDKWGIELDGYKADFNKVIQRRNNVVEMFRKSTTDFLEGAPNISFYRGTAVFESETSINIDTTQGDRITIQSNKVFINTGTIPRIPPIDGLKDVNYYTSKNWMQITSLPRKLIILGGGYIGVEFAQMFKRLGSRVSLFQSGAQLMPREDEDIAEAVKNILEEEAIQVFLNAQVKKVKQNNDELILSCEIDGTLEEFSATDLLVATGTTPATSNLQLSKIGIETDDHGYIKVNEKMETSVKGVFALGDVKGGPEFTHISYDDFRILDNHLFGDDTRFITDRPIPYTLFTDPQLGRVGLNEKMAQKSNIEYRLAKIDANYMARAIETGNEKGLLKVLIADNDTILGASLLMEEGGEMMAALQIAMMGKIKYQLLRDGVFAHPTYAEGFNALFSAVQDT